MKGKRFVVVIFAALAAVALLGGIAFAEYPTKPVTLVAPYGPGGASDLAARSLAAVAPSYVKEPVVVVNRTGAGGVVGSAVVARSKPNGYTLLLSRVGCNGVAPAINMKTPYTWDGFTFLGLLELNPVVYVVQSTSPFKSLKEAVEAIKKSPGKYSYSTSGPTTILNMGFQKLLADADLPSSAVKMVPYKGGGGAKTALLGGHVDFLCINLSTVIDQIQAGKLRALAVTTPERFPMIPEVPTVKEAGFPDLDVIIGWSGLWGPPKLPANVVNVWTEALQQVAKDKTWLKMTKSLGSLPYIKSPEETKAFVKKQFTVYRQLGEKLGLVIK
ncbi:MAG: tripartite tricarboxylate transporter substrate binding protein [Desulfarculaceae bacterium]|nr:tripartite tricarboxylate transporter substrate binding protein [Desulfarculaceae bacterium]MCF8046762.1 tripartite tricarboxylate transporter substrate binding protein [Desulfarculaceae bacterium]MCF8099882.1 tripartite tricarboxylate transporter substrate binding protein [Desulfarculaceae bacterium]MCF8124540.1 tripartite tricarboxylate transporter substrate binding protein [Desulfarculaceae bacterium]